MRRKRGVLTAMVCAVLIGCVADASDGPATRASGGSASGSVQLQGELRRTRAERDSALREVARVHAVEAEKDSALEQVRITQDFIDEVERTISGIPGVTAGGLSVRGGPEVENSEDIRTAIMTKLARARALVEGADTAIHRRDERVRELVDKAADRDEQLAQLTERQEALTAMLEHERETIIRLTARVGELEQERAALTEKNAALTDTVVAMKTRENTVYIAAGTVEELVGAGVVANEGGARIAFWKPGQTLQPTRTPPRRAFRVLDLERDTILNLPHPGATYRIVSKHNPAYLDGVTSEGLIQGRVRIRDPRKFWDASKWLVVAEQPQ